MISDTPPLIHREYGDLFTDSYFVVTFRDNSYRDEWGASWTDISEERVVRYKGVNRTVRVCIYPIKDIVINHNDLNSRIEIPDGVEVYQSILNRVSVVVDSERVIGRLVGLVKNGEVIEEIFLSGITNEISGYKK